jgi:hypothetical protein
MTPTLFSWNQRAQMSLLEYDCLSKHKVPIEKSMKLTTSNRNELEYIAELVVIAKGATNQVKLNQLGVS